MVMMGEGVQEEESSEALTAGEGLRATRVIGLCIMFQLLTRRPDFSPSPGSSPPVFGTASPVWWALNDCLLNDSIGRFWKSMPGEEDLSNTSPSLSPEPPLLSPSRSRIMSLIHLYTPAPTMEPAT